MIGWSGSVLTGQETDTWTDEQLDFFEKKIRPVLVNECYECHSAAAAEQGKLRGGLALDSRAASLEGGDSGPAVIPGDLDESLIISALQYDLFEMPPQGQLPEEVIADFIKWIEWGAPDPREGDASASVKTIDLEQGRRFWSFQPLRSVPQLPLPESIHPIDYFVHEKQKAVGLSFSPPADHRVLIRRAWFDLLGLPPTPADMKHWTVRLAEATTPNETVNRTAWGEMLDELLQRPEYGERWARHWLDVARFAESHGYEQDYDRPHAYHYRDFLIRAFNQDLPYDQMVRWQIAGDELQPENPLAWMATGFLGAGAFPTQLTEAEFESARYDELDDMVSTTSLAFLGLSIGCARCHDHKFDPIRAVDYYRFASIFSSAIRSEKVLDLEPEANRLRQAEYDRALAAAERQLLEFENNQLAAELVDWLKSSNDLEPTWGKWTTLAGDLKTTSGSVYQPQHDGSFLASGTAPAQETLTLRAGGIQDEIQLVRVEALTDPSLPHQGPGRAGNGNFALGDFQVAVVERDGQSRTLKFTKALATHQQNTDSLSVAASIDNDPISGWAVDGQIGKSQAAVFYLAEPLRMNDDSLLEVTLSFPHPNGQHCIGRLRISTSSLGDLSPEVGELGPDSQTIATLKSLQQHIAEPNPWAELSQQERESVIKWYRGQSPQWNSLKKIVEQLKQRGPQQVTAKVMVTTEGLPHLPHHADDRGFPHFYPVTHVLRRGDVTHKVSIAEPGFPAVLLPMDHQAPLVETEPESRSNSLSSYRRAALAQWLTDPESGTGSLVARVMVNRIWQHHFGRGIVSTPSDFGETGERPTHPELLDYLAQELIKNGWQMKSLHRLMMTSQTYMQGNKVVDDPRAKIDPENRWLWFRGPQRLEAEAIRDSMLFVSGELDPQMYGPGSLNPAMKRRSIYFFIKRSQLIPEMMLFDWPEHLVSIGQRQVTTIAPQALMFMNSAHGRQYVEAMAARLSGIDRRSALQQAYEIMFGRSPTETEIVMALEFLDAAEQRRSDQGEPTPELSALADYCQILMSSNEFIYVD